MVIGLAAHILLPGSIMVLAGLGSGEAPSRLQTAEFLLYPHVVERGCVNSLSSS